MSTIRPVKSTLRRKPTMEGAGVRLHRVFGFHETPKFDPFLLMDDFRSDNPADFLPGFPWHPHRGIETITYVTCGDVEHGDSLGNKGVISSGDVQWMTAGSGIVHQEMPRGDPEGRMHGFQLWANLPAEKKMMSPRYRDVLAADIPVIEPEEGVTLRIISGLLCGIQGSVQDVVIDPLYVDVGMEQGTSIDLEVSPDHNVFAYVFEGSGRLGPEAADRQFNEGTLVHFGAGDLVSAEASAAGFRFLLIGGKPLHEPIAWQGPIVMNTDEELRQAFKEYRDGTFLKHGK